jgi:iron(III) transport system substrate-binding protein
VAGTLLAPTGRCPSSRAMRLRLAAITRQDLYPRNQTRRSEEETMKRTLIAGLATLLLSAPALAQEPPALAKASGAEKTRVQELIKAATAEGQLSYIDAVIQPQTNDALATAFRKQYGLPDGFKVNYTLTNASGVITRIGQELQANRVSQDIGGIAALPWVFERVKAGDIVEYASPEYAAFDKAIDAGLGMKNYFAFNGAYIFVPTWNSETLKFAGKSWKDVVGAIAEGRINIGDASKSETYLSTYVGLRQVLGVEDFRKVAKLKPNFLVRSEQIVARLVSGEDQMAYFGMPTRAYQANERGAKVSFLLPQEGVVLLPQATFIIKGAPHPAAAKLWIDFILSQTAQEILVKNEALISGRTGFKSPIPDYAPSIDALNLIKVDWKSVSTADMKKAREEWSSIFNP